MATIHPSRRGLVAGGQIAGGLPPQQSHVFLRPLSKTKPPLDVGSRASFNAVRIELIRAMQWYARPQTSPAEHWLHSSDQIAFEHLPHLTDAIVMSRLISDGFVGVYWFVNHADETGKLSCGQLYDLLCALQILEEYLVKKWPHNLYRQLCDMLSECLEACCGLEFTLAAAPAPASSLDLSKSLDSLKHFLVPEERYDPSRPGLPQRGALASSIK